MIRLFLCVLLMCLPGTVSAQGTSDFTVRVFGSADTTGPTTPAIIAAIPVAPSQIDLTWSTSTDNFAVFGYVVFRDAVAIATTTALSYSDTGLTASTTYTYEVRAFDGVPNYSSSSVPVATTTPAVFVPPTGTNDTGVNGTIARVALDSFDLSVGVATASMRIKTKQVARLEVRVGTTSAYETMYMVGNAFKKTHNIFINDLWPNTKYFYEVVGYTPSGAQTLLNRGTFTTTSDQPPSPPTNVSNLVATQQGDAVLLSYELPLDFPQNGRVRVLRNHLGFPQYLSDGLIVYEGTAERIEDGSAFSTHGRIFYTVFVIDPNGLISSGAVIRVDDVRVTPPVPPNDIPPTPPVVPEIVVPDATTSPPISVPELPDTVTEDVSGFPRLSDFVVRQNERVFPFSSTTISLLSEQPFTISVPVTAVTGDFKTMVATLSDPRDDTKTFSFLLRRNGDQTQYSAVLAPLSVAGVSDLVVEVFDFDTRVISRYKTTLTFMAPQTASSSREVWYWQAKAWLWGLLLVVPLLVLLTIWFLFWKRDREYEDNAAI